MAEIARLDLVGIKKDGAVVPISLVIGAPHQADDHWRCSVAIKGIDLTASDIAGDDALQSLCLAVRFMQLRLTDFTQKGGSLFFTDGGPHVPDSEFPLEAYFGASG